MAHLTGSITEVIWTVCEHRLHADTQLIRSLEIRHYCCTATYFLFLIKL